MITSFLNAVTALASGFAGEEAGPPPWERLLRRIQVQFGCDACALLRLSGGELQPLATAGLSADTIGRRFPLAEHPRLSAIVHSEGVVRFPTDSPLPDPYDGLIETPGQSLDVHDCIGVALAFHGRVVGVITLDSLEPGKLSKVKADDLTEIANLTAALLALQTNIETLHDNIERNRLISQALMEEIEANTDIVGRSPQMQTLLREMDTVAASDLAVLVLGETGVGKELIARRIHARSGRAAKPLIYVNCAALPENLIESELFGHVRGAFTGALQDRRGRFEIANGGTLFLDEIGELSMPAQAKLLRALQSGEVQRVGSDKFIAVDVRLIAATNQNLIEEVKRHHFRADLYHRIAVYPLHVPALRDRPKDILPLAGHFLERMRARLRLRNVRLARDAEQMLTRYAWPGNVRELEHLISRAVLKAASEVKGNAVATINLTHLGLDTAHTAQVSADALPPLKTAALSLRDATIAFQRRMVLQALEDHDGNFAAAAKALKMDRGNLSRLAHRVGAVTRQAGHAKRHRRPQKQDVARA
jgi:anaerobic nitric oxide reductase transcription regulator